MQFFGFFGERTVASPQEDAKQIAAYFVSVKSPMYGEMAQRLSNTYNTAYAHELSLVIDDLGVRMLDHSAFISALSPLMHRDYLQSIKNEFAEKILKSASVDAMAAFVADMDVAASKAQREIASGEGLGTGTVTVLFRSFALFLCRFLFKSQWTFPT